MKRKRLLLLTWPCPHPPMALPPARLIFHDKGKCAPTSGLMHVNFTLDSCIACSWTSYQSLLKWPLLGKEKVFPPLSTEQHYLPPPIPEWSCVFALEWAPSVMLALWIVYLWPITGVQTLWQRNLNLLVTAVSPATRRVLGIGSMLDYTDQMNKQIKTVFFWESHNVQCMKGLEKLLSCLKSVLPTSNHITFLVGKKIYPLPFHRFEVCGKSPWEIRNCSLWEIPLGNTELLSSHFTGEETEPLRSPGGIQTTR